MENTQQQINQGDNLNQNPSPVNPILNQKGNFLIPIGVVLIILVVGIGAYYLGMQKNKSTSQYTQQASPSPTITKSKKSEYLQIVDKIVSSLKKV